VNGIENQKIPKLQEAVITRLHCREFFNSLLESDSCQISIRDDHELAIV
jgi:hypothetical protein